MQIDKEMSNNLRKEIEKIKEDALYSAKGHFEDAKYWRYCNYGLMICSIFSVCASLAFAFADFNKLLVGGIGFLSGLITMILIFLNSQGKYIAHQNNGNDYLALRNQVGYFVNIECHKLTMEIQVERLKCFIKKIDLLNKNSLPISKKAYKSAKRQIEVERSHEYQVDKEAKDGRE